MAIGREQILSILGALDSKTLLNALAVSGIHIQPQGGGDILDELALGDKTEQEKWNDIRIQIDPSERPPIHSPEKIVMKAQKRPLVPEQMQQPVDAELLEE
jgi:hypothetical protein